MTNLKFADLDRSLTHEDLNQAYGDKSMFFKNEDEAIKYYNEYKAKYTCRPVFFHKMRDAILFDIDGFTKENKPIYKATGFKQIGFLVSTPNGK